MNLPPVRLLHDALLTAARAYPDKASVVVEGSSHTYNELLDASLRLASILQQRGLNPGDRVVIFMANSWHAVVAIFGTLLAGGVLVIVNSQTKSDKLRYIIEETGAKILLTHSLYRSVYSPILRRSGKLERVIYSGREMDESADTQADYADQLEQFDKIIDAAEPLTRMPDVISPDLAAIIYTSGSTGRPKGVMQTHQAMVFSVGSLIEYLCLSRHDRIINVLPLAFDYGLYQLLMSVHLGATLILEHSFTYPAQIYKRILEEKATVFPGVPTIFSIMLASHRRKALKFDSVTRVTNTAAKLPSGFISGLKDIFPNGKIYKMYGLTECKRVSYLKPELIDKKPGSVGRAIPGTQLFLLSRQGEPVAPGERGMLYVRGPHVMVGYWKKPEQSRKMLKKLPGSLPHERVLCTQDLFTMDEDGDLYFVGRTDEIIKSRGEKVSPAEVENVLQSIEGIQDAAVIGIPDVELGESVCAFVSSGQTTALEKKKIMRICQTKLELFMVPRQVVILNELPKKASGKIDKSALLEIELTGSDDS